MGSVSDWGSFIAGSGAHETGHGTYADHAETLAQESQGGPMLHAAPCSWCDKVMLLA